MAAAPTISVDGTAVDAAFVRPGEIWISASQRGQRRIVPVNAADLRVRPSIAVAAAALLFDACPSGVVFADAEGLLTRDGDRVLSARALFSVPDPDALLVGDLCNKHNGELRMFTVDGLRVGDRTLSFKHSARAYSGRVHRGLRPERGYGEALSLYGPRLFDADIDGDNDLDLIAVREGTMWLFERGADGLSTSPTATRNLAGMLGARADADYRVRLVDIDGDKRAEAIVGVTEGAVPERSEAWIITKALSTPRSLWRRDGLVTPIGSRGKRLIVAEVDTSLASLTGVVITGRVPVRVRLGEGAPISLQAKVDVRAGRMDGALPVVSVDFDGDGVADLLDLGEPGRAAVHRGTAEGFALDPMTTWDVPAFVHVVPMPTWPGVVLIGSSSGGKTRVAFLTRARKERVSNCDPALDFDCR